MGTDGSGLVGFHAVDSFYNVCTDKRVSRKELLGMLFVITGGKKQIQWAHPSQATFILSSISLLKKSTVITNFSVRIDLNNGLQFFIDWRISCESKVAADSRVLGLLI